MAEPRILLTDGVADDARIEFPDHTANRENVWITIKPADGRPQMSLNIIVTDEGVVLDLYPLDMEDGESPVASTYAFYQDIIDAVGNNIHD